MELTYADVQNILKIVDNSEHLDELELVIGGFRLHVTRNGARSGGAATARAHTPAAAPSQTSVAASASPKAPLAHGKETPILDGMVAIRAPMLGTFYRAPTPGQPPFVELGQRVRADDTVCLIEVMKLFNSIRAGVDGTIAQILMDNESLVEFNQALILIAPDRKS